MQTITAKIACLTAVLVMTITSIAAAAVDPTTGIDWQADVATPGLNSAKPALLAGLAVFVLVVAVVLGKKLWGKVSGAK